MAQHDPLFEIDPRQFRAALEQAQGALGRAEAQLAKASQGRRALHPPGRREGHQPAGARRRHSAAERDARAAVAAAQAAVEQAALNLGWTKVTSPIDGIVGLALVQVGALVGPDDAS